MRACIPPSYNPTSTTYCTIVGIPQYKLGGALDRYPLRAEQSKRGTLGHCAPLASFLWLDFKRTEILNMVRGDVRAHVLDVSSPH